MQTADIREIMDLEALGLHLSSFIQVSNLPIMLLDAQAQPVAVPGLEVTPCLYCQIMQGCPQGEARCRCFRQQAGLQASRLGECYMARCPSGLIEIVVPILYKDIYLGQVSCGPVMMWEWDEIALREIMNLTEDIPVSREALLVASRQVPILESKKVSALADMLFVVMSHIAHEGMSTLQTRKEMSRQQSEIAEHIFARKQGEGRLRALEPEEKASLYPLQKEYELVAKVRMGDRTGAKAILNDLLGDIFFHNGGDMELIKARVVELVVVTSRAAVESGASLEKMLSLNNQVVAEFRGIGEFEEICMTVVRVLDTMMDTLYDVRNIRNAHTMALIMNYIREHYAENLSLEDVSGHVYLSPYYVSHLFKDEIGMTFVEYLTRVRIEEARRLLRSTSIPIRSIAAHVGYDDPGYFAKVFRRRMRMTPKEYRIGQEEGQDSPSPT